MTELAFNPLPWSYSKLTTGAKCSLACFLNETRPRLSQDERNLPEETKIGIFLHQLAHLFLTTGEVYFDISKDFPVVYFKNFKNFFITHLPKLKKLIGDPVLVKSEIKIRLDKEFNPCYGWPNGFLVGSIDLFLYNSEKKHLIIVDYKTTRDPQSLTWDDYKNQLKLYSFLFHKGYGEVKKIGLISYLVFTDTLKWLTDGLVPFDEDESKKFLSNLLQTTYTNLLEIKPTRTSFCKFCNHLAICPLMGKDDVN